MFCRYACSQISPDAGKWAPLLFGRAGTRIRRLSRLSGYRLAESMSAELLLCELLEDTDPGSVVFLDEDKNGKPFLPASPLSVSLSHSGGFVAAAIADVPVGIDLQEVRDISDSVLLRFFSDEERAWITSGNRYSRVSRLWSMKEAYVKQEGIGIVGGIHFFASFSSDVPKAEYENVSFLFPDAPEGLVFSICLKKNG